ncbi:MAG: hypothetical protein U5K56_13580 [Halioglobus sp.]|nr:hypothetical protein [Halioglobus sp.]
MRSRSWHRASTRTPRGLRHLVTQLGEEGYLSDAPPAPRFGGEPATRPGSVRSDEFAIAAPASLLVEGGAFLWFNHEGELKARLSLPEVFAAMLKHPITLQAAWDLYRQKDLPDALDQEAFSLLVARLDGAGLLVEPDLAFDPMEEDQQFEVVDREKIQSLVDARVAAHDREVADSGRELVQVVPVHTRQGIAPQALGLLVAYAMEYEGGRLRDRYDFVPMFLTDEARLLERAPETGVFLFSNYLWNLEDNLKLSAAVKAADPGNCRGAAGGPARPEYEAEANAFFADNPHVDITVRGEGEATFADLLDKLDPANNSGLEVLRDVPGLSYRHTGRRAAQPRPGTHRRPEHHTLTFSHGTVRGIRFGQGRCHRRIQPGLPLRLYLLRLGFRNAVEGPPV